MDCALIVEGGLMENKYKLIHTIGKEFYESDFLEVGVGRMGLRF